jgi:methyltransferase (TIGR00027 family)
MTKAAAKTAIGPIALIAVEQFYPREQRVVNDTLAYRMLPSSSRAFVQVLRLRWMRNWIIGLSEKNQPGIWGGLLCRKRYIDDKLMASHHDAETVVNLGAGFDTRLYRLPAVSNMPAWEVDQPKNIQAKRSRLKEVLGTIPSNINLVPIDFDREDLAATLKTHGYSVNRRTFFIMEAVTQYLTEQGIETIFGFLGKAASGSRLVFTYIRKDFLDGSSMHGWDSGYKRFVSGGIWHCGFEPNELPDFLRKHGWTLLEDRGYDELADEYLKPSGRKLASTSVERMVFAEKE